MYSALGAEELNFHAATIFATFNERQTHEGYGKIFPQIDNDRS